MNNEMIRKINEDRSKHTYKAELAKRLANDFTYHAPNNEQKEIYEKIREKGLEFALFVLENTPVSREQSLAFTELEKVIMFANAAIARNE